MAAGACAVALPRVGRADTPASLCRVWPDQTVGHVPADFTGLSYEAGALANASLFDKSNAALIGFVRTLGAKGILRIGGNSSEFTVWNPAPNADLSDIPLPFNAAKTHRRTPMTPQAIDNLISFVDAIDWKLIYGLNLGMGTADQAAEEAAYVVKAAGDRLLYLQIGNEPDLFHHNGLRPDAYGFDDFFAEWSKFADAVEAKTPGAPLAGPDVAHNDTWIRTLSEKAGNRIGMLSGHYYAEGPPTNPDMTIARLLGGNQSLVKDIAKIGDVSRTSNLPYRMTECNSCYSGGKKGVSDTFASALWAADYMLQLASAGYLGVNFHGGGSGLYTPIATDAASGSSARPIYYGMLLAGQFAGCDLVKTDFAPNGVNATAYAARGDKHLLVAITNKDMAQAVSIDVDPGRNVDTAGVWRLTAPSVDATSSVTLANASVATDGSWAPQEERADVKGGKVRIDLPASSAALLRLRYA